MSLDRVVGLPRRGWRRRKADFITLADKARDARHWEVAAQLYRKALDRYPRDSGIWVQYGHALKESGELRDADKLAQAESAYRKALSLNPGAADSYLQLGHLLKLQGKTEEAKASYLRAFALDPSVPYPLQELSGLGWSRAQLSELRAMLDSAVPLPANRAELTPNDEPSRPRDPTKPRESNGATQPPNLHSSVIAGSFDSLTGTIAAGWAWNPSDPDKPVEVKFCVGDKIVGSCRTRTSRHDVKAAGYAPGPCGFETELQLDLAANEAIEVRARVVETGAELVNSPRTPAEPPPPMARLVRKQRVTGNFLTRLRSRLNRETDGLLSIVMPVYNTKKNGFVRLSKVFERNGARAGSYYASMTARPILMFTKF
jgi:Flp pilus assembly protein TadD